MPDQRLLVVGLDAFDYEVAQALMRQGELPAIAALDRSALKFQLDHGIEKYTGLAWEQFASGKRPEAVERWSATTFDRHDYAIDQPTTRLAPFLSALNVRSVVFDTPYLDLARVPLARGMVSWGSHDPGVPLHANPAGLDREIAERFGPYPAQRYIYGHVWPSPERTSDMAQTMVAAVDKRTEIMLWLLQERLPDWQFGITVLSELHSGTEALWHGWDVGHPLHNHPSAKIARDGLIGIYRAVDRMIGRFVRAFPDARILAFSPHGMGRNVSDTTAMILVPELLYRHFVGRSGLVPPETWTLDGSADENFAVFEDWATAINALLDIRPARRGLRGLLDRWRVRRDPLEWHNRPNVDWMPAVRYRDAWRSMRAFAVPAYYDARVRLNLKGRETSGMVRSHEYDATLEEVEALIRACRDPRDGAPLAVGIERRPGDPVARHPSDVDMTIRFHRDYYAFDHPILGRIGPVPCRRTGGHSGGMGIGYMVGIDRPGMLGRFPTREVPLLVRALLGDEGGSDCGLVAALEPLATACREIATSSDTQTPSVFD